MTDLYLTTPDKASFIADLKTIDAELEAEGFDGRMVGQDEDGNDIINAFTQDWSIVYYGQRVKTRGEYDGDGNEITAPTFHAGDRVNIRFHGEQIESILAVGSANRIWRTLPNGTNILPPSESNVIFAGGRAANEILPTGN